MLKPSDPTLDALSPLLERNPDADGRVQGRDPMALPVDVLTATGHPARRTAALVSASRQWDGDEPMWWSGPVREYADIRQHVCMPCCDPNVAEVRRCTGIHCPFWPYRMGRNPHNPQRGRNPFEAA